MNKHGINIAENYFTCKDVKLKNKTYKFHQKSNIDI